jgi:hypothetical protein
VRWKNDFIIGGSEFISRYLIKENVIPNASGVIFKRKAYLAIGGVNQSFEVAGDWDLWYRMLQMGDFAFVSKKLNYFRFHDSTVRSSRKKIGEFERGMIIFHILQNEFSGKKYKSMMRKILKQFSKRYAFGESLKLASSSGLSIKEKIILTLYYVIKFLVPRIRIRWPDKWRTSFRNCL